LASLASLSEVEYTGPFVAGLLYLHSKGVAAPVTSFLALAGQVWYFWVRAMVGHAHEGGFSTPAPPVSLHQPAMQPRIPYPSSLTTLAPSSRRSSQYVPGALMRYAALPLMIKAIYDAL
jgi:hypothetical protein